MKPELLDRICTLLGRLYGQERADVLAARFFAIIEQRHLERAPTLRRRDETLAPDWFRDGGNAVYVLYADRFNPEAAEGTRLKALEAELPYLQELGANILHVLPIFESTGDAGFAVSDYRRVDARYGSNEELASLISAIHSRGMFLALDFVLNHVADEHRWAKEARSGSRRYREYFVWDETHTGRRWPLVPDIFPEFAGGHWDWVPEVKGHVWSTFYKRRPVDVDGVPVSSEAVHSFSQWDLNYSNPAVLLEMIDNMLFLANLGVDVLRLDAVPFLYKVAGTSCTSQPQVHLILKLFRAALDLVAPRAVLLAESVQPPAELLEYFGEGDEAQIAYNFALMPELWRAVIDDSDARVEGVLGDLGALAHADGKPSRRPHWWVLTECHDEVSLEMIDHGGARHLWNSFALRGDALPFRIVAGAPVPRGVSGTTYSLLHGDTARIEKLWNLKLRASKDARCPGTPVFFMGEELGVENDRSQLPEGDAPDTRYVKRVPLTRQRKERRHVAGTKEHTLYHGLRALLSARRRARSS